MAETRVSRPSFRDAVRGVPSRTLLLVLAPIVTLAVLLPNAWISEDAYISLRVAKNLLGGYGPVWNIDYLVQVFTHPLWMVVMTASQLFFPAHAAQALIGFSILGTLIALVLMLRDIKVRWVMVISVLVLLASKSFVDFATSGLENPLLYILVPGSHEYLNRRRVFWLTLYFALAACTRLDAAALFVPAFIPLVVQQWRQRQFWILNVAKGLTPLIAWELFSLFYYGYLLPNTYYAKVHTYIPKQNSGLHAYNYFANSARLGQNYPSGDRTGLSSGQLGPEKPAPAIPRTGHCVYLLAVILDGGDYMTGRFFAVPLILAVYLMAMWLQEPHHWPKLARPALALGLVVLAVITPLSPITAPLTNLPTWVNGIVTPPKSNVIELLDRYQGLVADEGQYYCPFMCLYNLQNLGLNVYYREAQRVKNLKLETEGSIGLVGYYGDPKLHVLDMCPGRPADVASPGRSQLPRRPLCPCHPSRVRGQPQSQQEPHQ